MNNKDGATEAFLYNETIYHLSCALAACQKESIRKDLPNNIVNTLTEFIREIAYYNTLYLEGFVGTAKKDIQAVDYQHSLNDNNTRNI